MVLLLLTTAYSNSAGNANPHAVAAGAGTAVAKYLGLECVAFRFQEEPFRTCCIYDLIQHANVHCTAGVVLARRFPSVAAASKYRKNFRFEPKDDIVMLWTIPGNVGRPVMAVCSKGVL
jgi:hypothetical protein